LPLTRWKAKKPSSIFPDTGRMPGLPTDMATIKPNQTHKPVAYKHEGREFI
jgi:hypothetical protein